MAQVGLALATDRRKQLVCQTQHFSRCSAGLLWHSARGLRSGDARPNRSDWDADAFTDCLLAVEKVRGAIVAIKLECGGTKHAQLHYEFELYQYVNGQQRKGRSRDGLPSPPPRWKDHAVTTVLQHACTARAKHKSCEATHTPAPMLCV